MALHLFSDLRRFLQAPDVISFNAAISSCEKVGHWQMALCLFADLPAAKLLPAAGFLLKDVNLSYHNRDL